MAKSLLDDKSGWDFSMPLEQLKSLPSLIIGEKVVIDRLPTPVMSTILIDTYAHKGLQSEQTEMGIYGVVPFKPRRLDGSDLIVGKENIYHDVPHVLSVMKDMAQVRDSWKAKAERGGLIGSMELQDLDKWTVQQTKMPGWFLEPPSRETAQPGMPPRIWRTALTAVVRRYAHAAGSVLKEDWKQLILEDSDPPDTMVGLPTLASGEQTAVARLLTLSAYPNPSKYTRPDAFLAAVDSVFARWGFEAGQSYSAVLATRLGPISAKKRLKIWTRVAYGYQAQFESAGIYNRVRHVFPASYPMNFLLSPLYVQLTAARKGILGLWHDDTSREAYVQHMRSQGRYPYSIDFSAMDMHIMPIHVKLIMTELKKHGFAAWPCELLADLMDRMGVFYPSFLGDPGETFFTGNFGWFSGWKLTAEVDTLFGATTLLALLEHFFPGTIKRWSAGNFVFAESGDDIIFTWPHELDTDQITSAALELTGAEMKVMEDALFLKKFLPIAPGIVYSRPMSRFVQQTFWNETRYTGIKGGEVPASVMRYALIARMVGLEEHPWFKDWWPIIFPALKSLKYVQEADSAFISSLERGHPVLSRQDVEDMQLYANRNPGYFAAIAERSKYEPSAAFLVDSLKEMVGIDAHSLLQQSNQMRRLWHANLFRDPTSVDLHRLAPMLRWRSGLI